MHSIDGFRSYESQDANHQVCSSSCPPKRCHVSIANSRLLLKTRRTAILMRGKRARALIDVSHDQARCCHFKRAALRCISRDARSTSCLHGAQRPTETQRSREFLIRVCLIMLTETTTNGIKAVRCEPRLGEAHRRREIDFGEKKESSVVTDPCCLKILYHSFMQSTVLLEAYLDLWSL